MRSLQIIPLAFPLLFNLMLVGEVLCQSCTGILHLFQQFLMLLVLRIFLRSLFQKGGLFISISFRIFKNPIAQNGFQDVPDKHSTLSQISDLWLQCALLAGNVSATLWATIGLCRIALLILVCMSNYFLLTHSAIVGEWLFA